MKRRSIFVRKWRMRYKIMSSVSWKSTGRNPMIPEVFGGLWFYVVSYSFLERCPTACDVEKHSGTPGIHSTPSFELYFGCHCFTLLLLPSHRPFYWAAVCTHFLLLGAPFSSPCHRADHSSSFLPTEPSRRAVWHKKLWFWVQRHAG